MRVSVVRPVRVICFFALLAALAGCGMRKNTALTRNYQAFITRYNIYYNGDEHYKTTLREMERSYEDDFTRMLYVHPADARAHNDAPQPSGDFTRSIEKAQKAIQLRSIKRKPARKAGKSRDPEYREWMRREEYNPFLHNAWLMLGRSQYNNGDFIGAASTFQYIAKHFSWLPATVTEARLWQARAYCALGWYFDAEAILTKIPAADLTSGELEELYDMAYASVYINSSDQSRAIPYVLGALRHASGAQKPRLWFLLGQLYARSGRTKDAYDAYGKAARGGAPYRTRLNARIRQSEVFSGPDITGEVKSLKRMARYERNSPYLDLIYYAVGNLYMSRRDTAKAVEYYRLAVDRSTRDGIDRAIARLALGAIYFDRRDYEAAQLCYAGALPMLSPDYPGYDSIKRRSDVLDRLAVYARNVRLNDSLLRLADMSERERMDIVNRLIADRRRADREEAERLRREEYLASQGGDNPTDVVVGQASAPVAFELNTDDSWYFYNNAVRSAGRDAFMRRWGARPLEDDWRRRDKSVSGLASAYDDLPADSMPDTHDGDNAVDVQDMESDLYSPEYYLSRIPTTPARRTVAVDIICDGMYNIGLILKDDLGAYSDAASEWLRLLNRYPDNVYRLDIYYNMYLMYMRDGDVVTAGHYRRLILDHFPDSPEGEALSDPDFIENKRRMAAEEERLYGQAYAAYIENRNADLHAVCDTVSRLSPTCGLMPKFMFLEALSYVTEGDADRFRSILETLLKRYPDTELTPVASSYLKGLSEGRRLNVGGDNARGPVWTTRLASDSAAAASDSVVFALDRDTPHLMVLVYPADEVSGNQLLYDIARHNFSTFVVSDFDLEPMNFGRLGLLVVKGFANFDELARYRSMLDSDPQLKLPGQVKPVMISVDDFNRLVNEGRSFDDYFRYVDERSAESPVVAGPVP